ncbi:6-phosphogluconolactonase [Anaeromyxobacter diazotrophicus]|uniref:6-phosphogluconolactonase n=1 Tax=Anaeromyxobacter diazotrophicus TaxID=2590199 RepID=A0A7I9VQ80_9BACT|nr:6-phosphogluconolactonase [Anaeromyxobacter diazotrophicus]GEJ58555.1 6-phosphogluconolactonase [Anaeromyxobacter diazotrophicus]
MGEPGGLSGARVLVAPDLAGAAELAAQEVVARGQAAAALRGRFALALAGGHTPRALHALLADPAQPFRARIPWARTEIFFGDERCVPPDHPDSNYRAAREALLARVPVPERQVHRLRGEDPDPAAAARAYEAELRAALGSEEGDGVPRLDLVLLGLGPDGHTASLFPGTAALEASDRLVAANHVPRLGAWRLTFTLPLLDAARAVIFLVAGAEKAPAVAAVLEGGADLPAARVRPERGELLWALDAAAASGLRR